MLLTVGKRAPNQHTAERGIQVRRRFLLIPTAPHSYTCMVSQPAHCGSHALQEQAMIQRPRWVRYWRILDSWKAQAESME